MESKNLNGYVRISTIISHLVDLSHIDEIVLRNAGERGTLVHNICEAIMKDIGEYGCTEVAKGYVMSFMKWWGTGKEIIDIERRLYCDSLKVTGQIDILIKTPQGIAIVDLKTSSKPSKTWESQASGYYYLCKKAGIDVKKIYFVQLLKTGKEPKVHEYKPCDKFFFETYKSYKSLFIKD